MSGSMFAVEQEDGVTGHLVLVSKELLLVFVREGRKLSQCDRYDDVTSDVTCQVSKSPRQGRASSQDCRPCLGWQRSSCRPPR